MHLRIGSAHARRRAVAGTHHPKRLRPNEILVLHGAPRLIEIADRTAIPQISVICQATFVRQDMALPEPAIRVRQPMDQGEIVAVGRRLYPGWLENILPDVIFVSLA